MNTDWMRTIVAAEPQATGLLLRWSDGAEALVNPALILDGLSPAGATVGDWGQSIVWPDGTELGADTLWLATLSALGREDARAFLEWRLANGLSLSRAAEELGLARRTVAYYSNGTRPLPKSVLLACKGWDSLHTPAKAA